MPDERIFDFEEFLSWSEKYPIRTSTLERYIDEINLHDQSGSSVDIGGLNSACIDDGDQLVYDKPLSPERRYKREIRCLHAVRKTVLQRIKEGRRISTSEDNEVQPFADPSLAADDSYNMLENKGNCCHLCNEPMTGPLAVLENCEHIYHFNCLSKEIIYQRSVDLRLNKILTQTDILCSICSVSSKHFALSSEIVRSTEKEELFSAHSDDSECPCRQVYPIPEPTRCELCQQTVVLAPFGILDGCEHVFHPTCLKKQNRKEKKLICPTCETESSHTDVVYRKLLPDEKSKLFSTIHETLCSCSKPEAKLECVKCPEPIWPPYTIVENCSHTVHRNCATEGARTSFGLIHNEAPTREAYFCQEDHKSAFRESYSNHAISVDETPTTSDQKKLLFDKHKRTPCMCFQNSCGRCGLHIDSPYAYLDNCDHQYHEKCLRELYDGFGAVCSVCKIPSGHMLVSLRPLNQGRNKFDRFWHHYQHKCRCFEQMCHCKGTLKPPFIYPASCLHANCQDCFEGECLFCRQRPDHIFTFEDTPSRNDLVEAYCSLGQGPSNVCKK